MGAVCSGMCHCPDCHKRCCRHESGVRKRRASLESLSDSYEAEPVTRTVVDAHIEPRGRNPPLPVVHRTLLPVQHPDQYDSQELYGDASSCRRSCICPSRFTRRGSSVNRLSSGRVSVNSDHGRRGPDPTPGRSQSAGRRRSPPFPSEDALAHGLGGNATKRGTDLVYVKPKLGRDARIVQSQKQGQGERAYWHESKKSSLESDGSCRKAPIIPMGNDGQKMSSNHESYLLSANTQTDMEDWVKAIRRVILSPFGGGIFGQRLDETLRYDRRLDSSGCGTTSTGGRSAKSGDSERRQAPIIVENCVEFIRNHGGLKEEGLFRLPGHANEVKDLQDAYDMGERPVLPSNTDVHTVASLLKGYLRELPEPIIPYDRYDTLISCAKTSLADGSEAGSDAADARKQEEKRVMKDQLNLLPQANFDLLRYMCRFLDEVQRHSDVNKMDISNLAMVFGPNIMRSKRDDPHTMMSDANLVQHVMFQFIDNHRFFFPDDEKTTPVSSLHSLPDVAMDAAGAVSAPDAGIGTLTSNAASPPGTLTQNRHTDDSGTGSMGPTPESTSKRAPPIPILPPPIRGKPNKPLRRKTSGQGLTPSRNGSTAGDQAPAQRKSLYDNVTASSNASSDVAPPSHYLSHKHDWRSSNESGGGGDLTPRTRSTSAVTTGTAAESYYVNNYSTPSLSSATPRSSTNAVAGSLGEAESLHSSPNDYQPSSRGVPPPKRRTSRKMRRDKSGCATDEESNTESVPPDDRAFSTLSSKRSSFQNDQDHRLDLKSAPSSGKVARPELTDAINRLSMDSVSDEASSASSAAPPVPSRPHRKNKKAGSGQNTGSERNSRSETEMTNDVHQVASNRSSQLPSSTANSVFGSALTYKELEEQVKVLQEELRKQRLEHEKRSRMLEEHYIMKMKSSTSMYSPFSASLPGYPNPHSPTSVTGSEVFSRTGMLDDSATDSGDGVGPTSPVSGRQSVDSQTDLRYKEEVKRHAMTKIRLRNAERGLQQAEERNKQLQKEMEEFFHTFGSMMNAEQPTSY